MRENSTPHALLVSLTTCSRIVFSKKVTIEAPSNIALVKYWGAKDLEQAVPYAPSLSMTLRTCHTRTTARFQSGENGSTEVFMAEEEGALQPADDAFRAPVAKHVQRLKAWAGRTGQFRIATRNSFPRDAGIASSASGFAALTLSVVRAMGKNPDPATSSLLARRSGSGSAARSVRGGFVEWPGGDDGAAHQLHPADHWDLRDVVTIVDTEPKAVSSREGHRRAPTSPFFETRLDHLEERLGRVRSALAARDVESLGTALERDGIELHLIAMSSRPPIFYWSPATLTVLERVRDLRGAGVPAYATMDAGANVHVLCPADAEPEVVNRIQALPDVQRILRDGIGTGPKDDVPHLF